MQSQILENKWSENERIPSVRVLAAQLEVNPNTCMRAFTELTEQNVIYNQRGVGYFVNQGANEKLIHQRKQELLEKILPQFAQEAKKLGINQAQWVKCFK